MVENYPLTRNVESRHQTLKSRCLHLFAVIDRLQILDLEGREGPRSNYQLGAFRSDPLPTTWVLIPMDFHQQGHGAPHHHFCLAETLSDSMKPDANSQPNLGNGSSRFELNSKAIRPQNSARLPTALSGLGEEDWETVSARTEAASPSFDRIALEAKTGSSLADTSDSGSLSLSKETVHPFRGMKLHPVTQHAVLPRQNHSFMLLKNSQTGDTKPGPVVVRDQEDGHREVCQAC